MTKRYITVSSPCKIHLLGEHAVVYGKSALLTAVNLRIKLSVYPRHSGEQSDSRIHSIHAGQVDSGQARMTDIFEPIIKKELGLKKIPPYDITIDSRVPLGCGLGSSAAISTAYFGAMLTFLGKKWNVEKINELAFEAEKVFHSNPSGGDNSTVCFGGVLLFRKNSDGTKTIKPLDFSIQQNISEHFVFINTGKPKESTREMVEAVNAKFKNKKEKFERIFDEQEKLVEELLLVLKSGNAREFIRIIKEGERNLEKLGVVSQSVLSIIRNIEKKGGAAKICGGGGIKKGTGILLTYHRDSTILEGIARSQRLDFFRATLGAEGVRKEN